LIKIKKYSLIIIGLTFLCTTQFIAIKVQERFSSFNECSRWGRVAESFRSEKEVSFWGSSTCQLGVYPPVFTQTTGKTSENFGITGLYFDQQFHLDLFTERNKGKTIMWVVNPYEYTLPHKKTVELSTFLPFALDPSIKERLGLPLTSYIGAKYLFQLDAKHWKLLLGAPVEKSNCEQGHITQEFSYCKRGSLYNKELKLIKEKTDHLLKLGDKITPNNSLVFLIPPNAIKEQKQFVVEFEKELKKNGFIVWNFATNIAYKDTSLFQDELHLNAVGAKKWSKEIGNLFLTLD